MASSKGKQIDPVKWSYRADIITACTCDWGCPCNFDAPPTYGYCYGGYGMKIRQGECGSTKLDGLTFAYMAKWPGAIHEGGGTAKIFIDERAAGGQRRALEQILKGKFGGRPWPIFAKTIDTWLDTAFVGFEWKFDGAKSRYKAGNDVLAALEPYRNPVTGEDTSSKILLPDALVCREVNITSTKSFSVSAEGLMFAAPGQNAWFGSAKHGT